MIRRPPRSTRKESSAASDVYKRQEENSGIKDWISMFAESFFRGVNPYHIEEIKTEVQEKVKGKCLINGKWFADYKRIRIVAIKE